jgi:hypothetical protein
MLPAQHFIGLNKEETTELARKSGFYKDNMLVNQKFNYLKFVNSADTKTLIVFFSDEDISTHTRTVCDYSEYDYVKKDLDLNYRVVADTLWEYEKEKQEYEVTLEEKEWYFVIRTKKKSNLKKGSSNG